MLRYGAEGKTAAAMTRTPGPIQPRPLAARASRSAFICGRRRHLALLLVVVAVPLNSCTGLSRPEHVVSPQIISLIASVDRSQPPPQVTVSVEGGEVLEIDEREALKIAGPGINAGRLLLFGKTDSETWYASLSILETSATRGCYLIFGDAAFDEPDAVVFVFVDMRDVGIRVHKTEGFAPPNDALTSSGQYKQGEVGHDYGSFCLNREGLVFAMP